MIHGPKDPDRYRIRYRNSRHYFDPLEADELRPEGPMTDEEGEPIKKLLLPAQSSITKAIPADALLYWAVGQTAEYAVDELERWSSLERADAVDVLKKAHRKSSTKAADRGTEVHAYLENRLRGRPGGALTMGDAAKAYIPVVDAFLEEQAPELVVSEVVGIGEGHGCTTDAILRLPAFGGGLDVLDWKTRNDTVKKPHVVYEKEVAQLGGNLDLRYWIVEDDAGVPRREPLPAELGAVLVTFTTKDYAIHRVDPAAAIRGFEDVFAFSEALKRLPKAKKKTVVFDLSVSDEARAPEDPDPAETPETGTGTSLRDDLGRRIGKIYETDEHFEALRIIWPTSTGLTDAGDDELPAIEKAVGQIEAKYGYPFDPPPSVPVVVEKPEPAAPTPVGDEGPDVGDDDLETVRGALRLLEGMEGPESVEWVRSIYKRAGNLSLTQRPTGRRARIGFSLVRLATARYADDELLTAVLEHAVPWPEERVDTDPAVVLRSLSFDEAGALSESVSGIVEEKYTFSVSADTGKMTLAESR